MQNARRRPRRRRPTTSRGTTHSLARSLAVELRFPFNESLHGTRRRGRHYAHSLSRPVPSRFVRAVRAAEQMVLSYLRQLQADSSRRGVSREDTRAVRHGMAWRGGVAWRGVAQRGPRILMVSQSEQTLRGRASVCGRDRGTGAQAGERGSTKARWRERSSQER